MTNSIRFVLDNRIVEIDFSDAHELKPTTTVLNYLRSLEGHKGVKEGCAVGDCGACTLVIAKLNPQDQLVYHTVDSCLLFLPMIHGCQLITIEDLAIQHGNRKVLHPVQQMLIETNGSQCGYCTPGVVMSLFGLFKNHANPSREVIEHALTGNLCRCTGYQSILEAANRVGGKILQDHFSKNEHLVIDHLQEITRNEETIEIKTGSQHYFKPFTLREV